MNESISCAEMGVVHGPSHLQLLLGSSCPEVLLGIFHQFMSLCEGPFLQAAVAATAVGPQDALGVLAISLASEVLSQEPFTEVISPPVPPSLVHGNVFLTGTGVGLTAVSNPCGTSSSSESWPW